MDQENSMKQSQSSGALMQTAFMSAVEISEKFASADLTSQQVVGDALCRISQWNETLRAFVTVRAGAAMREALASDLTAADRGRRSTLDGLPIAVKDLFDVAGEVTGAGSLALPRIPAGRNAHAVQKLEAAGAIVHGKTETVEFAFGGWGTNASRGTPRNPYDLHVHRVPGGSSSGSAVAVSAGLAVAALGTDTGGSIRTPASYCGLVGIKTTRGLIGRTGVFALSPTHDSVGVLTRTLRDAAVIVNTLSGFDPGDDSTFQAKESNMLTGLEQGVAGLRLGILPDQELAGTSDEVLELVRRAVKVLSRDGALVSSFRPPSVLDAYLRASGELMSAESYTNLASYVDSQDSVVDPAVKERVLRGKKISASAYIQILEDRQLSQREMLAALDSVDALVMPTCPTTAIPIAEVDETRVVSPFGRFVNYLDFAAISVPIGLTPGGLPVGLQIVVRPFDDALAFRIARAVERQLGGFIPPHGLI